MTKEGTWSREDVYGALFELFGRIENTPIKSRKLKHWDDCPEFPAIYQNQTTEEAKKTGRGLPTIWTLNVDIYIYVSVSEDEEPAIPLNEMLDKVTEALLPPEIIDNKQTLGGLVEDCWISGAIQTSEGVLGSKAVAIVPVKILLSP